MSRFVEYDPSRGMAIYEDMYDNHLQVHYEEDVEPLLELAKYERNNGLADRPKEDMQLYARIPAVIIYKLKNEYGVDIFEKDHFKKALDIINRDFPYLRVTNKWHAVRN